MQAHTLNYLLGLAAVTGLVHTALGPDHYVPFLAMARVGRWSAAKTLLVTLACGLGHVLGSVILGLIGVAVGVAVGRLEWFEGIRGSLAGWMLLGFGLAYTAWGLRRAWRNQPHSHKHVHEDGTVHAHEHHHHDDHVHVHAAPSDERGGSNAQGLSADAATTVQPSMTPWILFTIFVFGPCEPLIPQLMYPAAQGSWWGVILVTLVFAATTISTMTVIVMAGYFGLTRLNLAGLERYSHAAAGLALTVCGAALQLGL